MKNYSQYLIPSKESIKSALNRLNSVDALTLFVVDEVGTLVGSLTDGDIRRALVNDYSIDDTIDKIMFKDFSYLVHGQFTIDQVLEIKKNKLSLIPLVDNKRAVKRLINFQTAKSLLPVEAVIMAGGEGRRLRPYTESIPKPLLKVNDKPIIEYNIDRLADYGIQKIHISIKYLGHLIEEYFKDGDSKNIFISYVTENNPLGTIGAVTLIEKFEEEYIIIMNSDLLTNIDFEDLFIQFINADADMIIATVPYKVDIPYAVLETKGNKVISFKEKPTYTYYSNAGIYLLKKEAIQHIPRNTFFNATDLMEKLVKEGKKVLSYPLLSYWLDIGKHDDFHKAQEDVKHIVF